jgi:hypothetical protein
MSTAAPTDQRSKAVERGPVLAAGARHVECLLDLQAAFEVIALQRLVEPGDLQAPERASRAMAVRPS